MKLLVITASTSFYSPLRPAAGVFIVNMLKHMVPLAERVVVVSTLAWVPRFLRNRPQFSRYCAPPHELYEGFEIFRPDCFSLRLTSRLQFQAYSMYLAAARLCRSLHRRHKFDLVFCNSLGTCAYVGYRLARQMGIPSVASAIGSDVNSSPHFSAGNMKFFKKLVRNTDFIITVSDHLRREISRLSPGARHVRTFYQGVDQSDLQTCEISRQALRNKLGMDMDSRYMLSAGQLSVHKGAHEFYDCFAALAGKHPALRAIWAGEGAEEKTLRQKALRDGLAERFTFTGQLPRAMLMRYMRACDLMLFASHMEGLPNVVMESMAAGLPTIATAVGGIPELVRDGVNGLLVPAQQVKPMIAAVERILSNPQEASALAAAGRETSVSHFDVAKNTPVLYGLLDEFATTGRIPEKFPPCAGRDDQNH